METNYFIALHDTFDIEYPDFTIFIIINDTNGYDLNDVYLKLHKQNDVYVFIRDVNLSYDIIKPNSI